MMKDRKYFPPAVWVESCDSVFTAEKAALCVSGFLPGDSEIFMV